MKRLVTGIAFLSIAIIGFSTVSAQKGVINLDETVIKGRIQKPEAFYILQNANLSYERLEPKKSFIPELLDSVEDAGL